MNKLWKGLGRAAVAAATLLCAQAASAQTAGTSNGTAADTTVTNSVTVNYKIATVDQTPVTSNVTFKVDRKVNVVVAEVGTTDTQVVPGATNQVTTFTVLNASNAIIDINLAAALDLATGPRGQTQSFTATNVRIFRDANANGTFESGTDVDITANPFFDEVEVTTDGSATNGLRTVFIVADIPGGATNGQVEVVSLTAQARVGGTASTLGAAFTNDSATADDKDVVQNVFADGDGPATDDANRDGKHSDDDAYLVTVTALTVAKTVEVISDPINNTTNQKAIPGAVVRYCVLMTNNGGQAATDVVLSDVVPTELTYVTGSIQSGAGVGMTCAGATTSEDDNATDADDTDGFAASFNAGTFTVSGTVTTLPAGQVAAIRFNATVK
jgi:uncharacterized repeat protein (TIGR01451 family)